MTAMSQIATSASTGNCRDLLADAVGFLSHNVLDMENQRQYLKEWREFRGLTQEKAADRIEKSRNYLSELERGKRRYNEDILNALAAAYSCEPWELLGKNPLIASEAPANIFDYFEPGDRSVVEALIKKRSA